MFKRIKAFGLKGLALLVVVVFLFACCVIQDLTNLINNPGQPQPKWDFGFRVPVMEHSLQIKDFVDVPAMINDLSGDALSMETLDDGTYLLTFKMDFPGMSDFSTLDIDGDMSTQITGETFDYRAPSLPEIPPAFPGAPTGVWPIPAFLDVVDGNADSRFVFALADLSADAPSIDLSGVPKDINSDGSDDVILKGVSFDDAKIKVEFRLYEGVSILNGLKRGDLDIANFDIEGASIAFHEDQTNDNTTDFLSFTSDAFPQLMLDGDPSGNVNSLDVLDFSFYVNCSDPRTYTTQPLSLDIKASVIINGNIYLIGRINRTPFDLGISKLEGLDSLTDFLGSDSSSDATDDAFTKLQNDLMSSISLQQVSMRIDVTNDLPFGIDMTALFDSTTDYLINLPSDPTEDPAVNVHNGGIISYFDKDGDGVTDYLKVLHPDTSADLAGDFIIDAGPDAVDSIVLSNIGGYFQDTTNDEFVTVSDIFFGKTIDLLGTEGQDTTIDIAGLAGSDLMELSASITMPIALQIFDNSDDYRLLDGMEFPITADVASSIPLGNIKKLGVDLQIGNYLPFGIEIEFNIVVNPNDPATKKTISMTNGKQSLPVDRVSTLKMSINENFSYIDGNGDTVSYNGDLLSIINDDSTTEMTMDLVLSFLPTNGDAVFSENNYITVYAEAYGETTVQISEL